MTAAKPDDDKVTYKATMGYRLHRDPHTGQLTGKFETTGVSITMTTPQPQTEAAPPGEPGWYCSSVAQWMPEYSTEKINGYDGPFPTWQAALEALFIEVGKDTDALAKENALLRAFVEKVNTQNDNNLLLIKHWLDRNEARQILVEYFESVGKEARKLLAAIDGSEVGT